MMNDSWPFRHINLRILEEAKRLNSVIDQSNLDAYKQAETALDLIRQKHLEIAQSVEFPKIASSYVEEIVQANKNLLNLIHEITVSERAFADIPRIHQSWLEGINKPLKDHVEQIQSTVKQILGDITCRTILSERLFASIDFSTFHKRLALPGPELFEVQEIPGRILSTYKDFTSSLSDLPELALLPKPVLFGSSREVFITAYTLKRRPNVDSRNEEEDQVIDQFAEEVKHETSKLTELIREVDPALSRPYIGARQALHGRNTDKSRHVLASLREFWSHLLRHLAPDEKVLSWIPTEDEDLLHEGRPTRKARVLYICRNYNCKPFKEFVIQDTHALVKMLDLFHRIHVLDDEITDDQLRTLLLRTDSWIMFILQISKG